jgi:uncharacterized phage protein (TIGR02220 family)
MEYSFDIKLAKELGVYEAIFLKNMQFWIIHNKAHNKHFKNDRTWTYTSLEALIKLFPFWTKDQIYYIVQKLVKKSIILTEKFSKQALNHCNWYAFVDESRFLCGFNGKNEVKNIEENKEEKTNTYDTVGEVYPYNYRFWNFPKSMLENSKITLIYTDTNININNVKPSKRTESQVKDSDLNLAALKFLFKDFKEKMEKKEVSGKDIHKLDLESQSAALLAFMSVKMGKVILPVRSNIKPILSRLKEGINENDIRCVMMMKFQEWKDDPKMSKYIRVETIFRPSKFYDYLSNLHPVEVIPPNTLGV